MTEPPGTIQRHLGPEAAKGLARRVREGFFDKYLIGNAILDIGYRGGNDQAQPITDKAIGVDLHYPGYDGITLPFPDDSQDAVFASHVLEHIPDPFGALAEWYRVLKIGGHMVVAVPHRDLYERKPALPSRFNPDHKRFYTPGLLLSEVEEALPIAGYRIRSLRDIDDGFDYTVPPSRHALGSYEIELILQKIKIPEYASTLRPSLVAEETIDFYARMLQVALNAHQRGDPRLPDVHNVLSRLPLPRFSILKGRLRKLRIGVNSIQVILLPLIAAAPFDEEFYLSSYPDIGEALSSGTLPSAHAHFIYHGYFEGRVSRGIG